MAEAFGDAGACGPNELADTRQGKNNGIIVDAQLGGAAGRVEINMRANDAGTCAEVVRQTFDTGVGRVRHIGQDHRNVELKHCRHRSSP